MTRRQYLKHSIINPSFHSQAVVLKKYSYASKSFTFYHVTSSDVNGFNRLMW